MTQVIHQFGDIGQSQHCERNLVRPLGRHFVYIAVPSTATMGRQFTGSNGDLGFVTMLRGSLVAALILFKRFQASYLHRS